jgi:adenylyltransferase/sulfurtransferase
MVYNGVSNQFYCTRFQRRDDCMSHETYPPAVELPLRPTHTTAAALLAEACQAVGLTPGGSRLLLDRDLVVSIDCLPCGTSRRIMKTLTQVGNRQAVCPDCQQIARPQIVHAVEFGSGLAESTLSELGIPAFDMVRIETAASDGVFLLTGDRSAVIGSAKT